TIHGGAPVPRSCGVNSSTNNIRLATVPTRKYQSVATPQTSNTHLPAAGRTRKTINAMSQATPRHRCRHFIIVLRGSNPIAETTRDHGPSWLACGPVEGVT